MARTLALSTLVNRRRRTRANAPASRTIRRISSSPYRHRVDRASLTLLLAGLLALAEVHATGQLADDQEVHALEQFRS